jgi:hypothetical protein
MEYQTLASAQSVLDPFVQAYNTYRQALDRVMSGRELHQRLSETQRGAVQSWSEAFVPRDVQQQGADAYRNYVRAITDATSLQDLQRRAADAFAGYQQMLQDHVTPQRVQERVMKVYSDYARGLYEALAPEQFQEQVDAAYREYVNALKEAWAKVDPEHLDLPTLGAIAHASAAAGWLRAASAGTARQRWLAAAGVTAVAAAAAGTIT